MSRPSTALRRSHTGRSRAGADRRLGSLAQWCATATAEAPRGLQRRQLRERPAPMCAQEWGLVGPAGRCGRMRRGDRTLALQPGLPPTPLREAQASAQGDQHQPGWRGTTLQRRGGLGHRRGGRRGGAAPNEGAAASSAADSSRAKRLALAHGQGARRPRPPNRRPSALARRSTAPGHPLATLNAIGHWDCDDVHAKWHCE